MLITTALWPFRGSGASVVRTSLQVCDNPWRYDKVYYCKKAGDEEELIGIAWESFALKTVRVVTLRTS